MGIEALRPRAGLDLPPDDVGETDRRCARATDLQGYRGGEAARGAARGLSQTAYDLFYYVLFAAKMCRSHLSTPPVAPVKSHPVLQVPSSRGADVARHRRLQSPVERQTADDGAMAAGLDSFGEPCLPKKFGQVALDIVAHVLGVVDPARDPSAQRCR